MRTAAVLLVLLVLSAGAPAGEPEVLRVPEGRFGLEVPDAVWRPALEALGFAGRPLGYSVEEMANYGPAPHLLPAVAGLFRDVRLVPAFTGRAGDAFLARAAEPAGAAWAAYRLLGVSAARGVEAPAPDDWGVLFVPAKATADEALAAALARVGPGRSAYVLSTAEREAWAALPDPVRRLALRLLLGALDAGEILAEAFDRRLLAEATGGDLSPAALYALAAAPWASERAPRAAFETLARTDLAFVALASVAFLRHVEAALRDYAAAGRVDLQGVGGLRFATPAGPLAVLGPGDDAPPPGAAILVDLGGNDSYRGRFAAPLSLDRPVGVLVDLGGDDAYDSGEEKGALAAGTFGLGVLVDLAGRDRYSAGECGLGAALHGTGVLLDAAGDDLYEGGTWVQGAAHAGVGLLVDRAGNDRYRAKTEAQGLGGTLGVGVLLDVEGDDDYLGLLDGNISEVFRGKSVSMVQGAGFGRRADFGDGKSLAGGIGLLVEGAGDDSYRGGVYCQGAGYWWALGALEDRAGDDRYGSIQYSLGSAPHMAVACCVDLAGDDAYNLEVPDLYMQSVGCARDGSIAVFMDGAGNDRYRVGNRSAGSGEVNAIGVFFDRAGNDAYLAERDTPCPATPPFGTVGLETAEKASFRALVPAAGLFLDTGGMDEYGERKAEGAEAPPILAANGAEWRYFRDPPQASYGRDLDLFRPAPALVAETGEATVHLLDTVCNSYFVTEKATGKFVVVDPGPGCVAEIRAFIAAGKSLEAAWLTHDHPDHVAGLGEFRAAFAQPIVAHADGLPAIAAFREHWEEWGMAGMSPVKPPDPDRLVRDGEGWTLGALPVTAIHAPGHAKGSLLYRVGDALLFTGDVLFKGSVGRTDFDESEHATFLDSLSRKVWDLPDGLAVFPGHMETTTLGAEKRDNWLFIDFVREARGEPAIPRPWVGFRPAEDHAGPGLRVAELAEGSAAGACGVRVGDVVLKIDGREMRGYDDLMAVIRSHAPGDAVDMVLVREGKEETLRFVFGTRPPGPKSPAK